MEGCQLWQFLVDRGELLLCCRLVITSYFAIGSTMLDVGDELPTTSHGPITGHGSGIVLGDPFAALVMLRVVVKGCSKRSAEGK